MRYHRAIHEPWSVPTLQKCPTCAGLGWVVQTVSPYAVLGNVEDCPDCNGGRRFSPDCHATHRYTIHRLRAA